MSLDSGPVQTPMPGFLSLLNLKNRGLLPDLLRGQVQPTIDMTPFWLRGSLVNLNTAQTRTQGVGALGGFASITAAGFVVPDAETWYVEDICLRVTGAGFVDEYCFAYQVPGGINGFMTVGTVNFTSAAKATSQVQAHAFWLPPGAVLGYFCGAVAGAAVDFQYVGMRYATFKL